MSVELSSEPKTEGRKMKEQKTWKSDTPKKRPLRAYRPCECGCDTREGDKGVGYLLGEDDNGNGVTIWIQDESVFNTLVNILI